MDIWTQTGWTKAHIRHLFDATFIWDYLPVCLLRKDLFIQDYESGSARFCSPELVHAILAISSRVINENENATTFSSGWLGSQFFSDEAKRALQTQGSTRTLPNIQALGVLSLYKVRCGREEEALEFAETFVSSIIELCKHESRSSKEEEEYVSARATTYSGAISLIRYARSGALQLMHG